MQPSPSASDDEGEDEDQGLVMKGKKKASQPQPQKQQQQQPTTSTQPARSTVPDQSTKPAASSSRVSTPPAQPEPSAQPQRLEFPTVAGNTASPSPLPPYLSSQSRTSSDDTLGKNSQTEANTGRSITPAQSQQSLDVERRGPTPLQTPGHQRVSSTASARTLTGGSLYGASSPASISSRFSLRSRTLSLLPRENHGAAPPMLSTHNVLAGNLGSLQDQDEARFSASPSSSQRRTGAETPQAPADAADHGNSEADRRLRKASMTSSSSRFSFFEPSPSKGAQTARESLLGDTLPSDSQRRRTGSNQRSTNSLTAADAAKLAAKLRQARDALGEQSAGPSIGASRSSIAALVNASTEGKYSKPVISTFAKDQERASRPTAVAVKPTSVYAEGFTRMQRSGPNTPTSDNGPRRQIRYVARFGLGGPPIESTPLNEALLAPSFDGDEFEASWAPALANAAGLGLRSSRFGNALTSDVLEDGIPIHDAAMAFSGSAAVNGPNATPVHLIHGLTTVSPKPFPLDPSDAPSLEVDESTTLTADPATLRAIALTSQVLSTHRSHTMTRRYHDPMREGLERCRRQQQGIKLGPNASMDTRGMTGNLTPPSSGRRSAAPRHSPGISHYPTLGEAAEHPVKSLKRVWSGRSNLSASGDPHAGGSRR